jgi:hypothetical protein
MRDVRIAIISAVFVLAFGVSSAAAQDYDKSFLSDYSKLQATPGPRGPQGYALSERNYVQCPLCVAIAVSYR